jgi:hypothetical protein
MKRKITGVIVISLSFGLLWQALAVRTPVTNPCAVSCQKDYDNCVARTPRSGGCHEKHKECLKKCGF